MQATNINVPKTSLSARSPLSGAPSELDQKAFAFQQAEADLQLAKQRRDEALEALLSLVEQKEEGLTTTSSDYFQVKTTFKYNVNVDEKELANVRDEVPRSIYENVVSYKPTVSMRGLKELKTHHPSLYTILSKAITLKPAKPSIKVLDIDAEE